jgi:tetratricopeptide (TPR) repeat protein
MWKLSEMLQSQSRHNEAANVLEPFVERFNNEPMFKRQLTEGSQLSDNLMSSYHLYRGDEAREEGEMEKAKEHYWTSIGHSSDNVDALIGLYKISMSEKEQAKRLAKLREITSEIRVEIRETSEALKTSSSIEHSFYRSKLANHCNTLAWVVANTEGSKEEALFLSRKACTLNPESAEYLDTLAHCYAAMGKYQDAVQQQRRAVEIKPHHPELKKALYSFETKLRDSK